MPSQSIATLIRSLSDKDSISQDISEISSMIYSHLTRKYLAPIEQEIKCCSDECASTPTAEITLLEALKPFVSTTSVIDSVINAINCSRTIERLSGGIIATADVHTQAEDSAIHKDGVYELDTECIRQQSTLPTGNIPIVSILIILLLLSEQ